MQSSTWQWRSRSGQPAQAARPNTHVYGACAVCRCVLVRIMAAYSERGAILMRDSGCSLQIVHIIIIPVNYTNYQLANALIALVNQDNKEDKSIEENTAAASTVLKFPFAILASATRDYNTDSIVSYHRRMWFVYAQ